MEGQKEKASGRGLLRWNARRGRRRERGSVDGIANGVSPVGLSASGTGQLRWKGAGEGSGKEVMKVGCRKSGLLTKQMRRWQIVQE